MNDKNKVTTFDKCIAYTEQLFERIENKELRAYLEFILWGSALIVFIVCIFIAVATIAASLFQLNWLLGTLFTAASIGGFLATCVLLNIIS